MRAPITPGIHPNTVRINTIKKDPQPLSTTARGGNIMESNTLNSDMRILFLVNTFCKNKVFRLLRQNLLFGGLVLAVGKVAGEVAVV